MSINQFGKRLQNHRAGVLLCLVLFASGALRAEQLPIKTYTTADGLPRDQINRIVRDSHGFLWFCTPEGLARFDGYTFTNYTTDQGLPNRNVNDLLETRSGVYWLATEEGVCQFNPLGSPRPREESIAEATGSSPMFVVYIPQEKSARPINVLFEDHSSKIWCGTNAGLYELQQVNGRWQLRFENLGLPAQVSDDASVQSIVEDHRGGLWIGTASGLYRKAENGKTERYTTRNGLPVNSISALFEDRDSQLWAGTKSGLCEIVSAPDPNKQIVRRVYTTKDGLVNNDIKSLFQSSDGHLWIGIFGGLSEVTSSGGQGSKTFKSYTTAQGLSALGIFALAEDRDANLWLGTETAGAMKMARHGFITYNQADGLGSDRIAAIFEDGPGEVCVVSTRLDKWFINRFDGEKFTAVAPSVSSRITNFGWGWKQIHFQDREGDWWVPTGQGLYRFSNVRQIEQLAQAKARVVYTSKDGLPTDNVFRLYEDSRGDIWIATWSESRNELTKWERATQTFQTFSVADGLPSGALPNVFCEDHEGNLWIGYQAGLIRYRQGRFAVFQRSDGLPEGGIMALYLDHSAKLWVGSSRGGLSRVDGPQAERLRFVTYTTGQGLSSNSVLCITEDAEGRIYAGTGRGLDRLDPKTGYVRHYTSADGLARGRIDEAFRDRHGALWFGSPQGLSRLISETDAPRLPPPILISGLRIAGKAHRVSELGETEVTQLQLVPNQTDVQIDFVGLSFGMGEALRYQFMLEGVEREWGVPTAQRSVNYANLRPGTYRFLVRALTADGLPSSSPAIVAFTILPPVWQRWWFLALVALTASLAVYSLYRYRVARLLELERVRTRIATDLHDDIGSSLSQVSVLSEVIRRRIGDKPAVAEPLSMIANLSRDLIDSMNDIVWAINPKRDRLSDLTQRMRRFASDAFTVRDIEFSFSAPDPEHDTRLGADMRREIFLIFKESVNNVVRHSGCNEARIDFSIQHGALELRVYDDGRGFYPEIASDGNGLASMRQRALRIGGALDISSQGEQGTTVSLKAPLDDHHWIWRGRKPHG
jgi:ligand-binding sensor domain-containing protein/signal transduction histidine kinase